MVITTYRIPYKYGETITIKPIFDVHLLNELCDTHAFKEYLEDSDERTYFFIGGDLFDAIVIPDPRYAKHIDASRGRAIIDEAVKKATKILLPYKDKIIGMGTGNHEERYIQKTGHDPIGTLCKDFGCKHLGYSGLLKLILHDTKGTRSRTVVIRYHHGWGGGGRTLGNSLTKYEKDIKNWDANIFLYGHDHQRKGDRIPRLGLSGNKLISKPILIGVCGSYLKTYTETHEPSYSEEKGYPPVEIGGIKVKIKPRRRGFDGKIET
jgi:hypothetical protein